MLWKLYYADILQMIQVLKPNITEVIYETKAIKNVLKNWTDRDTVKLAEAAICMKLYYL